MKGSVAIVGAGPGDPGLVTEKGKTLLERADVIVYDRLVHPLLLEHTKETATRVYSGKIPRGHATRQSTIQAMLVRYAREGQFVVRLKGGDPGVFAHLGEEAEELRSAGIPYEVVPGLTAGLAGASYAGVPATYRSLSTSVAFVTGHAREETPLSDVVLPRADTLIFYMGMHYLPFWMDRLASEGWSIETPVVVVQWGTTSKQRTVNGTVQTIANEVEAKMLTNPALVIIGETARFQADLQWYEDLLLQGTSVLWAGEGVTGREETTRMLTRLGAHVFSYPGGVFTFKRNRLPAPLTAYQRVHFEDACSVGFFLQHWKAEGYDLRRLPAYVTGADVDTEEALRAYGLPPEGDGEPELTVGARSENSASHWQIVDMQPSRVKNDVFSRLVADDWINTVLFTAPGQVHALARNLDEELAVWCADKTVVSVGLETRRLLQDYGVRMQRHADEADLEDLTAMLVSVRSDFAAI
ncbi:uroporphyrinogen-III C-methyltransferase [Salicibibacter halophilus]|uniref:uroporphyrinogen-III C-methyltransferase n=1 Tax=Salicibibacter halophilus TaxID=2502791 RepID=A0A514LFU4_9BACI|nr:uroporphyrinogen-III C-methyltransferase [Salicibibacter halophilus]QDI90742.1 uroporphyrinogen-III C-methyltransferase [Salicibibacter halophilus]